MPWKAPSELGGLDARLPVPASDECTYTPGNPIKGGGAFINIAIVTKRKIVHQSDNTGQVPVTPQELEAKAVRSVQVQRGRVPSSTRGVENCFDAHKL